MAETNSAEAKVREIRRKTRRRFSSEEKIRIVHEGLRGEESIAELCRREGISPNLYYNWSKEFLEAGKRRLMGDTKREASSPESPRCARRTSSSSSWWRSCRCRTAGSKKVRLAGATPRTGGEVLGGGEAGDHPVGGGGEIV